jgi:hypothetical protein
VGDGSSTNTGGVTIFQTCGIPGDTGEDGQEACAECTHATNTAHEVSGVDQQRGVVPPVLHLFVPPTTGSAGEASSGSRPQRGNDHYPTV